MKLTIGQMNVELTSETKQLFREMAEAKLDMVLDAISRMPANSPNANRYHNSFALIATFLTQLGADSNQIYEKLVKANEKAAADQEASNRMLAYRIAKGLKQSDVADELGVQQAYISMYERGVKIRPEYVQRIEQYLSERGC